MAVSKTNKEKYTYYESDAGTTAGAVQELAQSLSDDNIKADKVVLFDSTNQMVVVRTY